MLLFFSYGGFHCCLSLSHSLPLARTHARSLANHRWRRQGDATILAGTSFRLNKNPAGGACKMCAEDGGRRGELVKEKHFCFTVLTFAARL